MKVTLHSSSFISVTKLTYSGHWCIIIPSTVKLSKWLPISLTCSSHNAGNLIADIKYNADNGNILYNGNSGVISMETSASRQDWLTY